MVPWCSNVREREKGVNKWTKASHTEGLKIRNEALVLHPPVKHPLLPTRLPSLGHSPRPHCRAQPASQIILVVLRTPRQRQ